MDSNYIKCPAEFKGAECEMHMVTTKHEFLQAVEENKFNLVLCDPKLPEFDGIDILKYIRDNI